MQYICSLGPLLLSTTHTRHDSFYVNWVGDAFTVGNQSAVRGNSATIHLAPYSSTNVSAANFTLIKVSSFSNLLEN